MTPRKDPAAFVRIRPWQERFFARVTTDGTSCWVWTGTKNAKGYGVFAPGKRALPGDAPMAAEPRRTAPELAHRFAYKALVGEPRGECLMHRCDRPECVNPFHLADATLAENNADMYAKGRSQPRERRSATMRERAARGERHACSVLTEATVREIRRQRAAGVSYAAISRSVGVNDRTNVVRDVCIGRTWRHIT